MKKINKYTTFINYMDVDLEVEFEDNWEYLPEPFNILYVHRVYCGGINITGLFEVDKGQMKYDLIKIYLEKLT
jgi:hypothetical protein